jgi:hypothetical protein
MTSWSPAFSDSETGWLLAIRLRSDIVPVVALYLTTTVSTPEAGALKARVSVTRVELASLAVVNAKLASSPAANARNIDLFMKFSWEVRCSGEPVLPYNDPTRHSSSRQHLC